MKTIEQANITISKDPEAVWNNLISALGLDTGYLSLPFEMPPDKPSPDSLAIKMRLQTVGTKGTVRAALLNEFDTQNKNLTVRMLTDKFYDSKPARDYRFSLHPFDYDTQTELRLELTMHYTPFSLFKNNKLADSMLSNMRLNM